MYFTFYYACSEVGERERETDRQRVTERETRERENRTQHRGVNMLTSTKVLKVRTIDMYEPRYEQRYEQIIERGALLGHAHYTVAMRISSLLRKKLKPVNALCLALSLSQLEIYLMISLECSQVPLRGAPTCTFVETLHAGTN